MKKNIQKILIVMVMLFGFVFAGGVLAVESGANNAPVLGGGANNAPVLGGGANNSPTLGGGANNYQRPSGVPKLSLVGIVSWLTSIMNQLIYLLITASLVVFLYGIFKLAFVDGSKPEAREQARKFMFWGIVSLFVMVSVWGLVNILKVSVFGSGDLIVPRLK